MPYICREYPYVGEIETSISGLSNTMMNPKVFFNVADILRAETNTYNHNYNHN